MKKAMVSSLVLTGVIGLSGCDKVLQSNASDGTITVDSSDSDCKVSASKVESGTVKFNVKNTSKQVTEFYVMADDGLRIVSEVENIGPGLTRDLVFNAKPGKYYTLCKPGMVGEGVGKTEFTVTDSGKHSQSADTSAEAQQAVTNYKAYVKDQTEQLLAATEIFAREYKGNNDEVTRVTYAPTRLHYERIEPIAESFGDLDPKLDTREADLAEGETWTGWHAIEKDLWPPAGYTPKTGAERTALADQLVADTKALNEKVQNLTDVELDTLSNGAIALLEEVGSTKVTGEEEAFSHTDISDFRGNIDGGQVLYMDLRDIVLTKNKDLADKLDAGFEKMNKNLDQYKTGDGTYKPYNELSQEQIKSLTNDVNSLSENVSQLTTTVLGSAK